MKSIIAKSRPADQISPISGSKVASRARSVMLASALFTLWTASVHAITPLADQPLFTNIGVPGNLALALSVEFPTAVSVAHLGAYSDSIAVRPRPYEGYFDPTKCYDYHFSPVEAERHFRPSGIATLRRCIGPNAGKWSGNFLNWATMQTIDPFRWALTGGYRVVDTEEVTILEKAWASGQGGTGNFPNKTMSGSALISGATPFSVNEFRMRIQGLGNRMRFTATGNVNAGVVQPFSGDWDPSTVYEVSVRVRVCDPSPGTGGVESNCKQYPSGHWKPEGLLQQYSDRMRFSVFGYLNDNDILRDAGVLRTRKKFVGPTRPVPGSTPVHNPAMEWDPVTGILLSNPDAVDAAETSAAWGIAINNSGAINYINKFGQITPGNYKSHDPVGELYYAALRYLRGLGNVSEWSRPNTGNLVTRRQRADGFPVIEDWDDPISYSCQRNFVLGIGDVNTHADKNVPGMTSATREPTKPTAVQADTAVDAVTWTNRVGALQGMGSTLGNVNPFNGCCNNNSALMAGLAYHANTVDIRPDLPGMQTVQTYWLDVMEFQNYKNNNQFYLAAKFGGMNVPQNFDPLTFTGPVPDAWWRTNTDFVGSQPRPDNFFTGGNPSQMISGLQQSFASIATALRSFTTSFSTSLPTVSISGTSSFSAQFDSSNWTGEITASSLEFDTSTGEPKVSFAWSFGARLSNQNSKDGWNSNRRIVTTNTDSGLGVPFRFDMLSTAQRESLNTPWRTVDDGQDYLNYLRGQRLHEKGSVEVGGSQAYRARASLVGSIVSSKARPVGAPSMPFAGGANPGYAAFRAAWANRPPMVYVGTNSGMVHGIDSRLTGPTAGREVFAYVPSALFSGPAGEPAVSGLASLGNPDFEHRYMVNASPVSYDIDFGKTVGGSGTEWRTVLLGGLGKGGRMIYAIDITDPATMTTEAAVASRVLWEFTDPDLGFTFSEPVVFKTAKYGWVVMIGSGYNNPDGKGYFFFINPRNGQLLEKVSTNVGSPGAQAGLAYVNAFVLNRADGTADAAYAGDLLGNVWRLDLTATSGPYPAPELISVLTDADGNSQPVTSRPIIEVDTRTGHRFVLVGTGRLLHVSDLASTGPNTFYAIRDGNARRPAVASDLPSGVSWPIRRMHLADNTNLLDDITYDLATQAGWYIELATGAGGNGWRVVNDPSAAFGVVTFASSLPSGDACNPSGSSRIYAVDLGTGKSVLTSGPDTFVSFSTALTSTVTDLRFYSVAGISRLIAGSDVGEVRAIQGAFGQRRGTRFINWREVSAN